MSEVIKGTVTNAGGGVVDVLVARSTLNYPALGSEVFIVPKDEVDGLCVAESGCRNRMSAHPLDFYPGGLMGMIHGGSTVHCDGVSGPEGVFPLPQEMRDDDV